MKKLLVIVVLGVAAWLLYTRLLASPEARICDRMAALCDQSAQDLASCEADLGKLRSALGDQALERVEDCMDESAVCVEAVSCMGTALTQEALEGALRGITRGLEQ